MWVSSNNHPYTSPICTITSLARHSYHAAQEMLFWKTESDHRSNLMSSVLTAKGVDTLRDRLVEIRRDFHMHPELAGEEVRTSGIVADKLADLGLDVATNVGGYGVVGLLEGAQPGPVVAWRADMDAFPSENLLDVPYNSIVPGVKHVCGHDVHTTVGLGIAEVLSEQRESIAGTIKFIFQPAEENATGAKAMIDEGVLTNPEPQAIFGLHVWPLPVNTFGSVTGMMLPGMHLFYIAYDFASATAEEVDTLSKKIHLAVMPLATIPMDPSVVFNPEFDLSSFVTLIPVPVKDKVTGKTKGLMFVVRTSEDEATRRQLTKELATRLDEILVDSPVRFTYAWQPERTVPPTMNDQGLEEEMRTVLKQALGEENLLLLNKPFPFASEDFAHYLRYIPGVYYWLGVANPEKGIAGIPHTPEFDVDEDCIMVGVNAMSKMLLAYLGNSSH
jgi:metal-dependent amidase/aminoacylase/carboxypeptidase family protein